MRIEKYMLGLIAAAIGIKLLLFLHIASSNSSSIMQIDSFEYLKDAQAWIGYWSDPTQGLHQSLFRTPGYPLFLAIVHLWLKWPILSIIFIQIILNVLTAIIVYKMMPLADNKIRILAAAIVLLDLPTTIYSTMLLTEALFLFVLALCLYAFIKYIHQRHLAWLIGSAFLLGVCVYIRPVGYFLGFAISAFILYLSGMKKFWLGLTHAMLFLVVVYGLLGIWQYRNLKVYGEFTMSSINHVSVNKHGIIGRYARETDPQLKAMPPALYYVHSVGRNFLNLMTTPGNMKYFHSKAWKLFGVIFGHIFVVFWWIGLIAAFKYCRSDLTGQFLCLVLLYFIAISLVSTGWLVVNRFRVPMVPSLAILSAMGWASLVLRGRTNLRVGKFS